MKRRKTGSSLPPSLSLAEARLDGEHARRSGAKRLAPYRGELGQAWLLGYDAIVKREAVGRPKQTRAVLVVGREDAWDDSLCRGETSGGAVVPRQRDRFAVSGEVKP